jgi:PKD repeat protein
LLVNNISMVNSFQVKADCLIDIELTDNPVTLNISNWSLSYFQMDFTGFPIGCDVSDGTYLGWCAQRSAKISRGVSHGVWVCSSNNIKSMFTQFDYVSWDKINYILNNKDNFGNDPIVIQDLIWNITDNISFSDPIMQGYIAEIDLYGPGYCPGVDDIIAILVKSGDDFVNPQRTFFEAIVPEQQEDDPLDDDEDEPTEFGGNHPPTADATAGEPYQGFIGESILFDGSLSYDVDGTIIAYYWQYGDGTTGTGTSNSHAFDTAGLYSVLLTVEDNDGATNGYYTTAEIIQPNRPPLAPSITGEIDIDRSTSYPYTIVTGDLDNDTIRYIIDWGDEINTTTGFYENNTPVIVNHSWNNANLYLVRVFAEDTFASPSDTTQQLIYVDVVVIFINDEITGYLIDYGKNGIFNEFHNNETGTDTSVEKNLEDWYLIDSDNDGGWNYQYRDDKGLLPYVTEGEEFDYTILVIILVAIVLIVILIVVVRKRNA